MNKENNTFPDSLLGVPVFQQSLDKGSILRGYQSIYHRLEYAPIGASFISPDAGAIFFPDRPIWKSIVYEACSLCVPELYKEIKILLPFLDPRNGPMPIKLIQSDVLPGLESGETLCISPFVVCREAKFSSGTVRMSNNGCTLSTEPEATGVFLEAPISHAELIEAPFGDSSSPLLVCWLQTDSGELPALIKAEDSGHGVPQSGEMAHLRGEMQSNVALGDYRQGAIYDFYSDYRVLADCFAHCEFDRCMSLFAGDSAYYTRGQLRAKGPADILAALNSVRDHIRATEMAYSICYVQIVHPGCAPDAPYKNGQKALGFINGQDRLTSLICIDVNEHGKISRLYTLYDFEEGANVRTTDDYHTWRHEFPDEP